MCPMRIFLVLFSALLASYFAWKNYCRGEKAFDVTDLSEEVDAAPAMKKVDGASGQMCSKVSAGFWTFLDMASGRFLWKNLRSFPRVHASDR